MESGKQIFLVDDDASIRKAMRRFLYSAGFDVQTFASAEEFLEFISPQVTGCLILDVRLPALNGLDLQGRLREMESRLKIIFITAFADDKLRKRAHASGAVAFLEKPVDHQDLLRTIKSIWNGDKVNSDSG
jgi:FixJ family two-component response regulator